MIDFAEIVNIIQKDWAILVVVFAAGGFWWQGKQWFTKMTGVLEGVGIKTDEQTKILNDISNRTDQLEIKSERIERTVSEIHEKVHEHDINLAVLAERRKAPKL